MSGSHFDWETIPVTGSLPSFLGLDLEGASRVYLPKPSR